MASIQTAHLPAPPEVVFGYLNSVDWFGHWYPDLKGVSSAGGEGLGRVHTARGGSGAIEQLIDFRIVGWDPPTGLAWSMENARWSKKGKERWTPIAMDPLALVASIAPEGAGSSLTLGITAGGIPGLNTGSALKDLLARPLTSWVAGRSYEKMVKGSLENLGRILSAAQAPA